MGLGVHDGGVGTVKFLVRRGAKVTITDLRPRQELASSLRQLKDFKRIRYVLGRHSRRDFVNAECIIKNPGVRPDSPYLLHAREHGVPVTSDMGIFFEECPCRIIGITGTRGKSTAASLIWKLLKTKIPRVWLGGNIRKSVLEFLPRLGAHDTVVLELSSFQLHDLRETKKSPGIGVMINIMPDHLNWHGTMQGYMKAKSIIFKYQRPPDIFFANRRDRDVRRLARRAPAQVIFPLLPAALKKTVDTNLGPHYRDAAALAIGVARHLGVGDKDIIRELGMFRGLEGRQEEIAVINGIHFINDTAATIPEAVIAALNRFRRQTLGQKLILIAGGEDKNLKFGDVARAIRRDAARVFLLPGSATEKIKKELKGFDGMHEVSSMKEAVALAYKEAGRGDYILLSPGAASFGLFLNEFDRGEKFIEAIKNLQENAHD